MCLFEPSWEFWQGHLFHLKLRRIRIKPGTPHSEAIRIARDAARYFPRVEVVWVARQGGR